MATARVSEHATDRDHDSVPGRITREIRNWASYRTTGGLLLPTAPGIAQQDSAPPDWGGGAYDFNLASLDAPLQCFFRDATDTGNRALVGVRNTQHPSAWMNFKALDISQSVDVAYTGQVAEWPELWTNSTLRFTHVGWKLLKEIVLNAPGHPSAFGFSVKLPANHDLVVTGNRAELRDGNGNVRILLREPFGTDANGVHTRCTLAEGAPRLGMRTLWIEPNASDMASAVYPVTIDPTATISGTTDVQDTFLQSANPTVNYGANNYVQVGNFGGTWSSLLKITTASIPTGTYSSFRFIGRSTQSRSETANVFRVHNSRNWGEGTATWNTYDGTNNWTTAGCGSSGNDYRADASPPQWVCTGTNQFYTATLVSSWCSDWKDATVENNGLVFRHSSGSYERISSTEETSNQLYFEIDYTAPPAGHPTASRINTVPHLLGRHFSWRR